MAHNEKKIQFYVFCTEFNVVGLMKKKVNKKTCFEFYLVDKKKLINNTLYFNSLSIKNIFICY